jgi:ribonucleoside-diphosphate reductase alpha chain
LIDRVVTTLGGWGRAQGYFADEASACIFEDELTWLLVNQAAAFNSPVWFNCGVEEHPQCSACFINSVSDTMDSILDLAKTEGLLFKYGSGSGTNLSPLRSSREQLSTGGSASGPVSFMRGFDAFAGVIKSGGKTRRAAKMVILNIEHPDIKEFIECKVREERKAWALIDAGYDGSFSGEAYNSVFFQNSNNSVRVSDAFMRAVEENGEWTTRAVTTGEAVDSYPARDLLNWIAEATHTCGDPGLQFDTTINDWHTCKNSGPINASNPCSEYMFLDNSACNLASLNLMKFRRENGEFNAESFRQAAHILIVAQDIIVDNASYPTELIGTNSFDYRPLGLGYANLGALLMARGLAYDSDEGRDYAATLTALLTGQAYLTSSQLAERLGTFTYFDDNREPMTEVIAKHRASINHINEHRVPSDLLESAKEVWNDAYSHGIDYGYRNAQVSVLAPTGTIGFMMDCDTTGVEPDLALVKYKKLSGGGVLKIVNRSVEEALHRLGYSEDQILEIIDYVNREETIEGAPHLDEEHLGVFDCAFRPLNGSRSIHYMGHIRMMGAVQPFLSGAISKTVNLPEEATVEDIAKTYLESWKLGVKAVAIYRNNSKRTQPMSAGEKKETFGGPNSPLQPQRRRLGEERQSITHKFSIAGHEGYITVGLYEDGTPGEIFVRMSKEGSVVSGLMDCFATATSIMLQYGVPLKVLVDKFAHTRFEPSGWTGSKKIPMAKSIMDYLFRWLALKFLPETDTEVSTPEEKSSTPTLHREEKERQIFELHADAPPCVQCGSIMVRNGACYKCLNCGVSWGCS